MQKLEIKGGRKISGTIKISGSKNATLPILAATILTDKEIFITNVPIVKDVETMVELLRSIGSDITLNKKKKIIRIINKKRLKTYAPYHLLKTMRAGVLVLGSLLTRYNNAKVESIEGLNCHGVSKIIDKGNKKITDQSVVDVVTFSLPLVLNFKVKIPPIE